MRNWLFIAVLFLPSVCFGQAFQNVVDASLYPSTGNNVIPPSSDYAILAWSHIPSVISGSIEILSVDIIPSVNGLGKASSSYGWYYTDPETDIRYWWSIIDSRTLYARSGNGVPSWILTRIQSKLEEKNLGTVEQRAAYISSFKLSNVTLIDTSQISQSIVEMLGPWAVIGLGLAIALFGIDLGTRSQKKLLGSAAKEARSAERKVINAQIRADGVAQAYRTRLSLLAQAKRGDIKLKGYSRFGARQAFYDTARDYADYKKSRGWTL